MFRDMSVLDTGAEAKPYSHHYILVHMNAASGGSTDEEVSGEVRLSGGGRPATDGQALARRVRADRRNRLGQGPLPRGYVRPARVGDCWGGRTQHSWRSPRAELR
jgi:hypothetical protein